MFNKRRMMFAVLALVCSSTAIAEPATIAYSQHESSVRGQDQLEVAKNMDLMLNEDVYVIRKESSKMEFRVDSPVGDVWASFKEFEGSFVMRNSGVREDSLAIKIEAESLDADRCLIAVMLKGESFFDVENFPSMQFVGSSFEWFNDREAVLKGHLTIKNVTRQVAFYVEMVDAEKVYSDRMTLKASTTIRRSEFGIYTLIPSVSDNVNVFMSIEAMKKSTALSML